MGLWCAVWIAGASVVTASAAEQQWLPPAQEWIEAPPSADPDDYSFLAEVGTNTRGRAGGALSVWGRRGDRTAVVIGAAGFLEVENVSSTPSIVPWEAYRANVGLRVAARLGSGGRGRWWLDGGFFHESDHEAAGVIAEAYGLPVIGFPNGTLSTFEYLSLYVTRASGKPGGAGVRARLGGRLMTPNLVAWDYSRRNASLAADLGIHTPISSSSALFADWYWEVVFSSYSAPRPVAFRGAPFLSWSGRVGLRLGAQGVDRAWDVFAGVRQGNGRGVAFAVVYPAYGVVGVQTRL